MNRAAWARGSRRLGCGDKAQKPSDRDRRKVSRAAAMREKLRTLRLAHRFGGTAAGAVAKCGRVVWQQQVAKMRCVGAQNSVSSAAEHRAPKTMPTDQRMCRENNAGAKNASMTTREARQCLWPLHGSYFAVLRTLVARGPRAPERTDYDYTKY